MKDFLSSLQLLDSALRKVCDGDMREIVQSSDIESDIKSALLGGWEEVRTMARPLKEVDWERAREIDTGNPQRWNTWMLTRTSAGIKML